MGRWEPTEAQKALYISRSKFAHANFEFIKSNGPIKLGCYVKYYNMTQGKLISGKVNSIVIKKQKIFTVAGVKVWGRNLHKWLIEHRPGTESQELMEKVKDVFVEKALGENYTERLKRIKANADFIKYKNEDCDKDETYRKQPYKRFRCRRV